MQYCLPDLPTNYLINKFRYRCKVCAKAFDFYTENGNDGVVKFVERNGTEIRWLPMYGQGGYLDLFERFMPGFLGSGKPVISPIIAQFMKELESHLELSEAGNSFEISQGKVDCPQCGQQELEMLRETLLMSPEVMWLKIDCELLDR